MANIISTLAFLPMAFWPCKELSLAARERDRVKEKPDGYSRIVRTFGSQSRERKRRRQVLGNRTCPGQSRSDHAYMVRATLGAGDLWRVRRVHGRERTPGSPEWSHSQSAHGASARPVLQTAGNRTH